MDEDQRRQIEGVRQPFRPRTPLPGAGPLRGYLGCALAFLVLFTLTALLYLLFLGGEPLLP